MRNKRTSLKYAAWCVIVALCAMPCRAEDEEAGFPLFSGVEIDVDSVPPPDENEVEFSFPVSEDGAEQDSLDCADALFRSSCAQVKRPWRAAIETFGLNVGVWAFDRFVMNEDFAKISPSSIWHNVRNGFVWDNDQFSTNLFAHPYHGGLYFNAARCNGLNFWESAPYAFGGSLMWEFCAEVEPPAVNDLIATTVGGIVLGEVTHRVSALVLDDSKTGFARLWREFLGTLICPMRGLNRIITGDAWRVRRRNHLYHDHQSLPVRFSITAGERYLADENSMFRGETNPFIEFNCVYGDPYDEERTSPYDFFKATVQMGLSSNQPLIGKVNLLGQLWSVPLHTSSGMDFSFGLYQHFNYYDSEPVIDGSQSVPYKISEAASLGPGFMYRLPVSNHALAVEQELYLSAILLGGGLTDYYNVIDRNYNMGSGYSVKSATSLVFGDMGRFSLGVQFYQIFTWKGYSDKNLEEVNPLYLNAQGDKGNAVLAVVNPGIELNITKNLLADLGVSYFLRRTHYSNHKDVRFNTFEARLGLKYEF